MLSVPLDPDKGKETWPCHTCSVRSGDPLDVAHQTVPLLPLSVTPCPWLQEGEWEKKPALATTLARMLSKLCSGGSDRNEHSSGAFYTCKLC